MLPKTTIEGIVHFLLSWLLKKTWPWSMLQTADVTKDYSQYDAWDKMFSSEWAVSDTKGLKRYLMFKSI